MTTTQTTEQSLAALLEAAPADLAAVLTRECPAGNHGMYQSLRAKGTSPRTCKICGLVGYGFNRTALPVPEATLAAMQWCFERGWLAMTKAAVTFHWYEHERGYGPDIFAAIRAALEAK